MGGRKILATIALASACGALALPSMASAARSGVTIHLYTRFFHGYVFSPNPSQCAKGRAVKLFRQKGKTQNPKRDVKVAKTQAYRYAGGRFRWTTREPTRPGHFYARVPAAPACHADNSKTIRVRTVTIHLSDYLKGFVFSPKPRKCGDGRTVKLLRQKGRARHPKRDIQVAKTVASSYGAGRSKWTMAAPSRPGRFYARVPATSACHAGNSQTIRVFARPNTRITHMSVEDRRNVTFNYRGFRGIAPYNYRCKLDDQSYRHCGRFGKTYREVGRGHHVFKVRAVGANRKKDRTPARRRFRI